MASETTAIQPTKPPTLLSMKDWHVGAATIGGETEIRIVLTDHTEARAWAVWLLANCDYDLPGGASDGE